MTHLPYNPCYKACRHAKQKLAQHRRRTALRECAQTFGKIVYEDRIIAGKN